MGNQPDHYTFRTETGEEIKLDRVTAILGRVVRKPELERWNYWRTIDSIAGLVDEGGKGLDDVELRDILTDSLTIDDWLRLNKMRPDDFAAERSGEGEEAHEALRALASQQDVIADPEMSLANVIYQDRGGYVKGVADWWLHRTPEVQASETLLYSLQQRYAGRCDLIVDKLSERGVPGIYEAGPKIIDLKTRKSIDRPYMTDILQVTMYAYAYVEMHGMIGTPATSVLLVDKDGRFAEHNFDADLSVVPHILSVDRALRKGF